MPYSQITTQQRRLFLAFLLTLTPALLVAAKPPVHPSTTYTIVRHAEKATAAGAVGVFDAKDPPLSALGMKRPNPPLLVAVPPL